MNTQAHRQPSLRRVAEVAGVSVSTVSRYVNGKLLLSTATESRVHEAMRNLGYQPLPGTSIEDEQHLQHNVIGILVPHLGNAYFGQAANEVVRAARNLDFSALIASARDYSGYVDEYIDLLMSVPVKGLICVGDLGNHDRLLELIQKQTPVVVTAEDASDLTNVDTVVADDYSGAFQATKSLIALGHQQIAFIGGPHRLGSSTERERGWRDALSSSGIDPNTNMREVGPYSVDFGAAALARLLTLEKPPTAVFAASDTIALGMLGAAPNLGISVPKDLSIIGYDDAPAAALVAPRLTTVKTPLRIMAETSITFLKERIANPSLPPRRSIIPVSFVQGLSTAPCTH